MMIDVRPRMVGAFMSAYLLNSKEGMPNRIARMQNLEQKIAKETKNSQAEVHHCLRFRRLQRAVPCGGDSRPAMSCQGDWGLSVWCLPV